MAFRVVYRIKGRCSRHPAYNPVKDEQGGIKGGCEECHALFRAYRAYLAFREAIEEFETTVQLFITNKQARGRSGEVRRASAFGAVVAHHTAATTRKWRCDRSGGAL